MIVRFLYIEASEDSTSEAFTGEMCEMRRSLMQIRSTLDHQRFQQTVQQRRSLEWHAVAHVLDRFFFTLYVLLIAISLATLFPRATPSRST